MTKLVKVVQVLHTFLNLVTLTGTSSDEHMTNKTTIIVISLVAILAFAGLTVILINNDNGPDYDDSKVKGHETDPYTIIDADGVTHNFDKTFGAVAVEWSISGGPFITMAALLGEELPRYLVGIDSSPESYRLDSWEEYCKSLPGLKKLPKIGEMGNSWDMTYVLTLQPEALIIPLGVKQHVINDNIDDACEKAGIPIVYIDFHKEDPAIIKQSILNLGKMFEMEERAEELADLYVNKVTPIYEKAEFLISQKGYKDVYNEVVMYGGDKFGKTRANNTDWGALIYRMGGNSIAETTGTMDSAKVLAADPDKLFFTGSYWPNQPDSIRMGFGASVESIREKTANVFSSRPGWDELTAYKEREVYITTHGLARDLYDFVVVEFIAQMMFPEEFKDLDPLTELRNFYQKYLPFDFSGVWFYTYKSEPITVTDFAGQKSLSLNLSTRSPPQEVEAEGRFTVWRRYLEKICLTIWSEWTAVSIIVLM